MDYIVDERYNVRIGPWRGHTTGVWMGFVYALGEQIRLLTAPTEPKLRDNADAWWRLVCDEIAEMGETVSLEVVHQVSARQIAREAGRRSLLEAAR